jgi:hypothetical protein
MSAITELKTHLVLDLLTIEELSHNEGISDIELEQIELTYSSIYNSLSNIDKEIIK